MSGNNVVWTIVGILAIFALIVYLFGPVGS
jgi:hypothetical protein